MMYKDGEFKPGKSRADDDMTKLGEFWIESQVMSAEEFEKFKEKAKPLVHKIGKAVGNVEGAKRVKFE